MYYYCHQCFLQEHTVSGFTLNTEDLSFARRIDQNQLTYTSDHKVPTS